MTSYLGPQSRACIRQTLRLVEFVMLKNHSQLVLRSGQ